MRVKVSLTIQKNLVQRLRERAKRENLSLSRLIENLLLKEVEKEK